jgi:hypothetical protein
MAFNMTSRQAVQQALSRYLEDECVLVETICNSSTFQRHDRAKQLLRYLLRARHGGRQPLEKHLAEELFGFDITTFDKSVHSDVRVGIGLLRKKLAEYYGGEGKDDFTVFSVPTGQYRLALTRGRAPKGVGLMALYRSKRNKQPFLPWLPLVLSVVDHDHETFIDAQGRLPIKPEWVASSPWLTEPLCVSLATTMEARIYEYSKLLRVKAMIEKQVVIPHEVMEHICRFAEKTHVEDACAIPIPSSILKQIDIEGKILVDHCNDYICFYYKHALVESRPANIPLKLR